MLTEISLNNMKVNDAWVLLFTIGTMLVGCIVHSTTKPTKNKHNEKKRNKIYSIFLWIYLDKVLAL